MAFRAGIECKACVFRQFVSRLTLWACPLNTESFMNRESLSPAARRALAGLALSMLLPSLDTSIANVGLPTLATAFAATFAQAQWIVLAYLLAITTLIVSVGRLGDLLGRRCLLLTGIGIFSVASLLCGLAPDLWWLIGARAVQGLGAAIMLALTMALVNDVVPKTRVGSAMGLLGTMSAVGTTLGPSLGGLLIAHVGWPSIFLLNVPLGVLNGWLVYRYLPVDRPLNQPVAFDPLGTLLLAATLAAYALAMTLRLFSGQLLLVSLLGAVCFVQAERRARSPLIRLALFADSGVGRGVALTFLVTTVMMTTLIVGPFYLGRGLGLSSTSVGLALSVGPLMAALAGVPSGGLVDRFGDRRVVFGALLMMTSACALLALLPMGFGLAGYLSSIVMLTTGYALFQAGNNTGLMTGVSAQQRGVVSALLGLARNLGLVTGVAAMGAVFTLATGEPTEASATVVGSGLHVTFGVATALLFAALVLRQASVKKRERACSR